jgi:hypothetical protein
VQQWSPPAWCMETVWPPLYTTKQEFSNDL